VSLHYQRDQSAIIAFFGFVTICDICHMPPCFVFGHFEPIAKFSKFSFLSLYNKTQIKTGVVSLLWLAGLESPYYQCLYLTYYLVQNISSDHISSRGQITSFGQVAKMINMPWLGRPFPLLFMKIPTKTVKALKRLQI